MEAEMSGKTVVYNWQDEMVNLMKNVEFLFLWNIYNKCSSPNIHWFLFRAPPRMVVKITKQDT